MLAAPAHHAADEQQRHAANRSGRPPLRLQAVTCCVLRIAVGRGREVAAAAVKGMVRCAARRLEGVHACPRALRRPAALKVCTRAPARCATRASSHTQRKVVRRGSPDAVLLLGQQPPFLLLWQPSGTPRCRLCGDRCRAQMDELTRGDSCDRLSQTKALGYKCEGCCGHDCACDGARPQIAWGQAARSAADEASTYLQMIPGHSSGQ